MKAVILAGGVGSRISEEAAVRPKPMIEIGGKPILWHIMKLYSAHGVQDFIICLGYRGYMVKEYFANYYLHTCDITFDIAKNAMTLHQSKAEPWTVTLVDTGEETMTGGRLKQVLPYVGDESFCFTYGDGVADIDLEQLVRHHRDRGTVATVTAVQPPGRFGAMRLDSDRVTEFVEKPEGDGGWINGGFFVLEPSVDKYIEGDASVWEQEPLRRLAEDEELTVFRHTGFWQPMDTLRDKNYLEELWAQRRAPWKQWP